MAREEAFHHPPETVFQACINAVAYLEWAIQERDESLLRIKIRTPFTMKKTKPSLQDEIDVEIIAKEDRSIVWVDSNPRFQLWNWWKDRRNEKNYIGEVAREVERITTPAHQSQQAPTEQGTVQEDGQQPQGQSQHQPQQSTAKHSQQGQPQNQPQQSTSQHQPQQGVNETQSQAGQSTTETAQESTGDQR